MLVLGRIKILKEHITEKYNEGRSKRINRIAQEIRENVDNRGKMLELKRKLEKKVQTPYSITNTEGIRLKINQTYKRNIQNILKHYQKQEKQKMKVKG